MQITIISFIILKPDTQEIY